MHREYVAGQHSVLEIHHTSDGQPSLNTRRPMGDPVCRTFKLPHPEIEESSEVEIQSEEHSLKQMPKLLRIVAVAAPDELLLGRNWLERLCCAGSFNHRCHKPKLSAEVELGCDLCHGAMFALSSSQMPHNTRAHPELGHTEPCQPRTSLFSML